MKIPKKQNHYCPKCKKHTEMAVSDAKKRTRSTAHPMSRGSTMRMRGRGLRRGYGNQNKYSRPPVAKFKRTGAKISKKTDLRYKCSVCNRIQAQSSGQRMKKMELKLKMSKGKFVKVRWECKNEQVVFEKAATDIKCLVCDKPMAKSTGGKAKFVARELEVLN